MDHITRIKHMFYRKAQKNSYEESVEWIIGKLNRGWDKIELSEGREIVKCRYDAAKITFGF